MRNTFKIILLSMFIIGFGTDGMCERPQHIEPQRVSAEIIRQQPRTFFQALSDFCQSLLYFAGDRLWQALEDENGHAQLIPWPYLGPDDDGDTQRNHSPPAVAAIRPINDEDCLEFR